MEASVATGGEAAQGEAQAAEQQQSQVGSEQLLAGFEAMRGEIEQMRSAMAAQQQAGQQEEGQQEEQGFDFSWLDELGGDGAETGGLDLEALRTHFGDMLEQARAEGARAAQPAIDAVNEMRIRNEAAALVQEFPAIGEPETAQNVTQGAAELAAVIGQQVGLPEQAVQQLANSPALWRVVYMAAGAAELAQQQDGAAQAHAHLEGGGSRPAPTEVDPAQAIVGAGRRSVLPFS